MADTQVNLVHDCREIVIALTDPGGGVLSVTALVTTVGFRPLTAAITLTVQSAGIERQVRSMLRRLRIRF